MIWIPFSVSQLPNQPSCPWSEDQLEADDDRGERERQRSAKLISRPMRATPDERHRASDAEDRVGRHRDQDRDQRQAASRAATNDSSVSASHTGWTPSWKV